MSTEPMAERLPDEPAQPYVESVVEAVQRRKAFTYHQPKQGQPDRYTLIRNRAGELAKLINQQVPPSRERSLAMTKLEEVMMWANAGIARNE